MAGFRLTNIRRLNVVTGGPLSNLSRAEYRHKLQRHMAVSRNS